MIEEQEKNANPVYGVSTRRKAHGTRRTVETEGP